MGRLIEHGWSYPAAKAHMGNWYKAPTGMGAGVMGLGYWCFATNVGLTIFQSRLVRVPKPQWHLWKFFATGAAALTVGTVQGVIQVQPANADWLYRSGHAGEWIDPISHAHINLVTGLTMLVAGAFFALVRSAGGTEPSRRLVDTSFYALLGGSLAFYFSALYLGFHEGRLVHRGLTPEQAEEATRIHPFLIMGAGIAMFAAFWLLLVVIVRSVRGSRGHLRPFVLAGCAALAVGHAAGPGAGLPARERGARPRGRGRRRDRQPARPAEHARRADAAPDGALARRRSRASAPLAGAAGAPGDAAACRSGSRVLRRRGRLLGGRGTSRRRAARRSLPRSRRSSRGRRSCSFRRRSAVLVGFGAFSVAVWRMTARQRARGSRCARGHAARLLGDDSEASPAPQPGRACGLRAAARA